ncbi:hypothetical protein [Carboxylicivirga sp. RSCT41]|uniref:hypothetical protein n=1 Tax=Carboxylicivirga agarovorans TaxID=3417570 RepID=UPI003D33056B
MFESFRTLVGDALTLTAQGRDHQIDLYSLSTKSYAINKLQKWTGFNLEDNYSTSILKGDNIQQLIQEELLLPMLPDN